MPDVLRGFLTPGELDTLRALADDPAAAAAWQLGRQGTGYDLLALRPAPPPVVERALALLGTPFEDFWDAYLLRYRDGAFIPPHVDPAEHGRRHRRLNAMVTRAIAGGDLRIDGALVELDLGDAVLFYSDRERHEVSRVSGTRLLLSVGAWV